MVFNEDDRDYINGDYINIPVEKIQFSMADYVFNNGWSIPSSFHFKVEDPLININIDVEAISITHQISFFSFNYWRYHVNVKGVIKYDIKTEYINNTQIMDFTKLW